MKLKRDTAIYRYLSLAFDVESDFRNGKTKSLVKADFCRMVRVSLYLPVIWILQSTSILLIAFFGLIWPFINTYSAGTTLIHFLWVFGFIAAVLASLALIVFVGYFCVMLITKIKDKSKSEFVENVYLSFKHKFCPLVEIEG